MHMEIGVVIPQKLEELAGGWVDEKTLKVPGTDGVSYSYFGPRGKNGVLLAGRPNGPDQTICVLTVDLRMKRVSPSVLRKILVSQTSPARRRDPARSGRTSRSGARGR